MHTDTKTPWTPGPLRAGQINEDKRPWAVINPNGPHGDEIVGGFMLPGDAMLFAAAPDLYEALEAVLADYLGWNSVHDHLAVQAMAALSRARGDAQ